MTNNGGSKLSIGDRILRASLSIGNRPDIGENNINKKRKSKEVFNFEDISNKRKPITINQREDDPNDDICLLCGDGGTLICCDSCPSAFHQNCLNMKEVPSGDWNCSYYHKSCLAANRTEIVHSIDAILCGNKCQEIFERLTSLLGVKHEINDGLSWSFIRRLDFDLNGLDMKSGKAEWNVKIAFALSLMNDNFGQCIDPKTGIDLIHGVLYSCGSKFNRLNFERFVTAILEKGDEVICAASIRIHENQVAEMPYIATQSMYRRQGMCTRFLKGIESALKSLNVEFVVIPAIPEVRETWTRTFGFEPLEPTTKKKLNDIKLLVFPGVEMLQKRISSENNNSCDRNMLSAQGLNIALHCASIADDIMCHYLA
ncbi:hypothetical protein RIF29_37784 [Crotalaria pallida]|uniref:Uncharacterized protein n=1 Tax=Crotalaria pallida TaxID=3830 RepID=A0AAN9HP06_CROPI